MHPGTGVSSICHAAQKIRLFLEKRALLPRRIWVWRHEIVDYFRMLNSRFDKQEKGSKEGDSRFEALQEDLRNTNQRLEELQLRVPRPRLADVVIQEGKSGELEGIATEAGEKRNTLPEPQRQQPLLPSQPPQLPPQPPMMPQSSMYQPPPPPPQQLHFTPSMIGKSNHRSPAGAGARGAVPARESPAGIPWKLNPLVFNGAILYTSDLSRKRSQHLLNTLALGMFSKTPAKSQLPIPPSHMPN